MRKMNFVVQHGQAAEGSVFRSVVGLDGFHWLKVLFVYSCVNCVAVLHCKIHNFPHVFKKTCKIKNS